MFWLEYGDPHMLLDSYLEWLQATAIATLIRENEVIFPWIEAAHVLAIASVVGTICIVDLRLLGIASLDRAATRVMRDMLPYTWGAFAMAASTGALLFSSNALTYAHNFYFAGKFALLAAVGLNMAAFHLVGLRGVERWDATGLTPLRAKTAGGLSIALWMCLVAFGRWVGFTLH